MERELGLLVSGGEPSILFSPLRHTVSSGGKRLRALLVLLGCESVGGRARRALRPAVAIECLHNFTLIHDDVMDESPVRRGRPTVHEKWNPSVAILAGDHLIALGYGHLLDGAVSPAVLRVFNRAFLDVCEGQGYDMDFESRRRITMHQYRLMIGKKTARVIAAAAEIGALTGGGTPSEVASLRKYGQDLGMAFQIRDDVLDVTGTTEQFGKKIGGDIARGKKTFLLVKALENTRGEDRRLLEAVATGMGRRRGTVAKVRTVYFTSGAVDAARREIDRLTRRARRALDRFPGTTAKKALLDIAGRLAERSV